MTLERDAAFLAGFIVGTYDLRGDAAPPAFIQPFLDRVLMQTSVVVQPQIHINGPAEAPKLSAEQLQKAGASLSESLRCHAKPTSPSCEPELPELTRRMLEKANKRQEEPGVILEQPERKFSADDEGEDRKELVRRFAGMGWTDAGIAKKLGLTLNGVFSIRKRHGIPSGREQKARGLGVAAETPEVAA